MTQSKRRSPPHHVSLSHLARDFASPPHASRPIAWWMLNGDLKPDVMRWQLERFAEYGFGGYATYPYRGLTVPYHSDEWWAATGSMLESSRDLGLDAWIFDDFNWPSGHCAGYVLRDQPWLRAVVLRHYEGAAEPDREIALAIDGDVLAVVLEAGGTVSPIADWALETLPEETRLHWRNRTGKPGRIHVMARAPRRVTYFFAHGAPWALGPDKAWGHLDLLNPDGIRTALRYTQEQYAARFPEMLGATIKGFFTDENVLTGGGLPYTAGIEDEFARRYRYDLRPRLHELFIDTGDYLKVRYDYWRIAADWIAAHYYQPYRDWCDDHGLALIGHLCGEEGVGGNVGLNADVFEAGRRLTHPGMDMLYGVTGYDASDKWNRPGNHYADADIRSFHMTMKLAQSTAKHAGAPRMFDEAFCCEDYAANPQGLKRSCNYYAAFGVSQLLISDFNYSHAGIRKRRGGSKCFGTPWNRFYRHLTDYIARLSVFAAAGNAKADIGILYPRATAWCHRLGEELGVIDGLLYGLHDALIRSHWQFDFVYEQLLEKARVTEGRLRLRSEQYRVLIAPGCKALTEATMSKLEQFVEAGGVLLVMPPFGEESPDCPEVAARAEKLLQRETCMMWRLPEDLAAACAACDETFGRWLTKPLSLEGDRSREMVVAHRALRGADAFLVANMSDDEIEVRVSGDPQRRWELWDLETGGRAAAAIPCGMRFAPAEAVVLCARGRSARERAAASSAALGSVALLVPFTPPVPLALSRVEGSGVEGSAVEGAKEAPRPMRLIQTLSGPWRFSLSRFLDYGNTPKRCTGVERTSSGRVRHRYAVLRKGAFGALRHQRLSADAKDSIEGKNQFRLDARIRYDLDDAGLAQHWERSSGDDWEPLLEHVSSRDLDARFVPAYWLRAAFDVEHLPDDLELVVDSNLVTHVFVNQREATGASPAMLWHLENRAYGVRDMVHPGANDVTLRCKTEPLNLERICNVPATPVVLTGSFSVSGDALEAPRATMPAGPWHENGYPHFAGTAVYETEFAWHGAAGFLGLRSFSEGGSPLSPPGSAGVSPAPSVRGPYSLLPTPYSSEPALSGAKGAAPWPSKPRLSRLPRAESRGAQSRGRSGPGCESNIVHLDLGKVGDVAEVWLNDACLGARLWKPYRFDVTRALREGRNTLRIAVTSGIGNLLPYGYTDQLVPGPVPYGLLEPPRFVA